MSKRILLTAFKPFLGRQQNRSETVCRRIGTSAGNADVDLLVMPTDQQAEAELRRQLAQCPGGIVMTGEIGGPVTGVLPVWTDVRIERAAIDPGQQVHALGSLPWARDLESEFARYLETHVGTPRTRLTSSIGAWWCNRVYHQGLNWSSEHGGAPCVFLHLAASGDLDNQVRVVARTLDILRRYLQ